MQCQRWGSSSLFKFTTLLEGVVKKVLVGNCCVTNWTWTEVFICNLYGQIKGTATSMHCPCTIPVWKGTILGLKKIERIIQECLSIVDVAL